MGFASKGPVQAAHRHSLVNASTVRSEYLFCYVGPTGLKLAFYFGSANMAGLAALRRTSAIELESLEIVPSILAYAA
jgi:hypothetical protein